MSTFIALIMQASGRDLLVDLYKITADDIAARYGGEEFAILMFDHTFEKAYQIAENIRHAVEKMTFHEKTQNISVTVSIGLKSYTEEMNKDAFFQEADDYLYQAKRSGKNKIVSLNHIA